MSELSSGHAREVTQPSCLRRRERERERCDETVSGVRDRGEGGGCFPIDRSLQTLERKKRGRVRADGDARRRERGGMTHPLRVPRRLSDSAIVSLLVSACRDGASAKEGEVTAGGSG